MMCVVLKKIYEYSGGNMGRGIVFKIHMNGCGIDIKRIYGWEGDVVKENMNMNGSCIFYGSYTIRK